MDPVLESMVFERLAESDLDERAQDLVLAACGGAEELEQVVGGAAAERPAETEQLGLQTRDLGVYLSSVTVGGFRGIGPPVGLEVTPGPGLTLVAGRNGSGKSSFAEGLELLLTGANSRWLGRTKVWTEGWRNLHAGDAPALEARLQVEGEAGTTVLLRKWSAGDGLADGTVKVTDGAGADSTLEALGWTQAVARYRPFLSFNELGQMFDKLATMYDALSAILGLEDVDALGSRLRDARLARDRLVKASRDEATGLRAALATVDDERAAAVLAAMDHPVDLDAIELELEGLGEAAAGDLGVLRSLAALTIPGVEELDERLAALVAAAAELETVAATDAGRARGLAQLLGAALDHHGRHAFEDCPVCGAEGVIGAGWAPQASAEILRLGQEASAADAAVRAEREARDRVTDLVGPQPPPAVAAARELGLDAGPVEQAWSRWREERDRLEDPSSHTRLRETVGLLAAAVTTLREAAAAELDRREDAWRPVGRRVAAWVPGARAAAAADIARKQLKAAEDWVKATAADLQAARLAPIADAAKANWELLRRESNVSLEGFALRRSGNTKLAEVDVRVDGSDASAFGVMSQGELHALAVSVFLPRATLPESPFRFVVIDDPVQSMDPAKVDGLARALARAAETRQVIVFTHDERLPEAARRLGLDATKLEVTRHPGSVVEVRTALDPVERYLEDARALVRSDGVPAEVVDRVVPGFCRHAIEAACTTVVRRRRIGRGDPHAAVEAELQKATTLYVFLSLALFDDPGRGSDVLTAVNNRFGKGAGDAVRAVNRGVHEHLGVDPRDLVRDAGTFARRLAEAR